MIKVVCEDVMMEAAGTSLQIHLQVEPKDCTRHFNASILASAPVVAAAANSPYLFGKDLWDETRIAIFEEAVKLPGFQDKKGETIRRVSFGSGYIKKSIIECYLENRDAYPVLLPVTFDAPEEKLSHLKLHNGTIWRWNRPIMDITSNGKPHIRIEHRVPSAGPSIIDVVANIAFYMGLVHSLAKQKTPPETKLSFDRARTNFYRAAQFGLNTKVLWTDGKKIDLKTVILDVCIPEAKKGLANLGFDSKDIHLYLDEVITPRIKSEQTGAKWQRLFIQKNGHDFEKLAKKYFELQEKDKPVHEWPV